MTGQTIRLLLISEDPGDAGLVLQALADHPAHHFPLMHSPTVREALGSLSTGQIDVILLELGIEGAAGLDAVLEVRRRAPTVPLIVLTRQHDIELARRAMEHGAQDYVEKAQLGGRALARAVDYAVERHQAAQALRESQTLLQSFYESAPLMMGMVELRDDDIVHLSDNAASAGFLGMTPETMKSRRASTLGVPRRVLEEWIGRYEKSLRTGRPVSFEYAHERPGGARWLSVTVRPLNGIHAAYPRFCYVAQDVTESKQADEQLACAALDIAATNAELAEARDRAMELAQLKSEFLRP